MSMEEEDDLQEQGCVPKLLHLCVAAVAANIAQYGDAIKYIPQDCRDLLFTAVLSDVDETLEKEFDLFRLTPFLDGDVRSVNLDGMHVRFSAPFLDSVSQCFANVDTLSLRGVPSLTTDRLVKLLAACPLLTTLDVSNSVNLRETARAEFTPFSNNRELRVFRANFVAAVSEATVAQLAQNCPNLEVLEMQANRNVDHRVLERLTAMPKLRRLVVADCLSVDARAEPVLCRLRHLTELDVSGTQFVLHWTRRPDDMPELLKALPNLRVLGVGCDIPNPDAEAYYRTELLPGRAAFTQLLSCVPQLEELDVAQWQIKTADLEPLRAVPNLRVLSLRWTLVDGGCFAFLAQHTPRLRSLDVSAPPSSFASTTSSVLFRVADVRPLLAACTQLKHLNLRCRGLDGALLLRQQGLRKSA